MTSQIDATKPGTGAAFTADMRANFDAAATEISALQDQVAALAADVAALKAREVAASATVTPNPPNTNSDQFVTAGIGVQFQPRVGGSTRAVVLVSGELGNTQNGNQSDLQLVYGEGDAPAFGTVVSTTNGQLIGGVLSMVSSRSNDFAPFSAEALITGLTPGTLYWLGVAFRATSGGNATLSEMSLVAFGLLDSIS